jgi:adenylyltransferase/sulfurtransferase
LLAGAGVGTIGIIDDDRVDLTNLHRQVTHRTADVGTLKTACLARTVRELDPTVTVREHALRLTSDNALEVLGQYDLVIDGSDNFPTRYLVGDAAELLEIPLVWGSILRFHGQVGLAWHRYGPGYRDLFPTPPRPEDVVSCGSGGVLPSLCGTIGSLLASETITVITGVGEPLLGRVLVHDASTGRTRELSYGRNPRAEPVTELVDYELFCAGPDAPASVGADELAGLLREGRAPQLVDVRTAEEAGRSRVPGAVVVPLDDLLADAPLPAGELVVHCERDPRSVRAVRHLRANGRPGVRYLRGGIQALARIAPDLLVGTEVPVPPSAVPGASVDTASDAGPFARVTEDPIDVETLHRAVATDHDGAVLTFLGVVRDHDAGRSVRSLDYSAHPEAADFLAAVLTEETARTGVRLAAVHRVGSLAIGDAALVTVAASPHRGEAFDALEHAVDRIKAEVPIWKRQHFTDGESSWVGL